MARQRRRGGRYTEPILPDHIVAQQGVLRVRHFYGAVDVHRREHGPAHLHIMEREHTLCRIGQNGHPLRGEPALTADQQALIESSRLAIRRAVRKIARWWWYHEVGRPRMAAEGG